MVKWKQYNGTPNTWDIALQKLQGATLHQSYAWGEARQAIGWKQLRFAAYGSDEGEIFGLAQVSMRRAAPGLALCWIPGGMAGDITICNKDLRQAITAVISEPLVYCRMNSLRKSSEEDIVRLRANGWCRPSHLLTTGLSLDFDLRPDEQERVSAASGNWRHNLKRSNKYGLQIERWVNPDPEEIIGIYHEMEHLKGLEQQHSLDEIRALLASLGEHLIIYRCKSPEGDVIALRGCGVFSDRGWDLLAAAAPPARKVYASHALFWAVTSECRRLGLESYDLSGVDPVANKGVYDFKKGTGAAPMQYLGEWEWANLPGLCSIANLAIRYKKGAM